MASKREHVEDPAVLLPDHISLAEFTAAAEDATTILELQRAARLPRCRVKRLLFLLDGAYDLRSVADGVEALRR